MKNFYEFNCLFNAGINSITGEDDYDIGITCIDLNAVVAFNSFTLKNYTVVRLLEGSSFIIEIEHDELKSLIKSKQLIQFVKN